MFRGTESSNIIELSQLVPRLIEFWCFGLPVALGVGGWVDMGGGWLGNAPTHVHMHTCMCTHAHTCMVNMIISCKWQPPLGEFPMSYAYAHVCIHVHMCGGTLLPPSPTSNHPPPLRGIPKISQNSIALELIKIFQFRLKI